MSCDLLVEDKIIVKAVTHLEDATEKEIVEMKNILRLSEYEGGLILNFGPDGQHKRIFLTNAYKGNKTKTQDGYKRNLNQ